MECFMRMNAAEILCDMCKGQHMERSQAKEGKD